MKQLSICKEFHFDSAHLLPNHEGKCKNMHGHRYNLWVWVKRTDDMPKTGPDTGMVIDFSELKTLIQHAVKDDFDHKVLNEITRNPTAENLIEIIAVRIQTIFKEAAAPLALTKLQLWETPDSFAEMEF